MILGLTVIRTPFQGLGMLSLTFQGVALGCDRGAPLGRKRENLGRRSTPPSARRQLLREFQSLLLVGYAILKLGIVNGFENPLKSRAGL